MIYEIKAIAGVARTTSTVVLNTEFEDRPLDLSWVNAARPTEAREGAQPRAKAASLLNLKGGQLHGAHHGHP